MLVCEGQVLHAHHLPPTLQTGEHRRRRWRSASRSVGAYGRDLITDALKSARGNRARAARLLQTTAASASEVRKTPSTTATRG